MRTTGDNDRLRILLRGLLVPSFDRSLKEDLTNTSCRTFLVSHTRAALLPKTKNKSRGILPKIVFFNGRLRFYSRIRFPQIFFSADYYQGSPFPQRKRFLRKLLSKASPPRNETVFFEDSSQGSPAHSDNFLGIFPSRLLSYEENRSQNSKFLSRSSFSQKTIFMDRLSSKPLLPKRNMFFRDLCQSSPSHADFFIAIFLFGLFFPNECRAPRPLPAAEEMLQPSAPSRKIGKKTYFDYQPSPKEKYQNLLRYPFSYTLALSDSLQWRKVCPEPTNQPTSGRKKTPEMVLLAFSVQCIRVFPNSFRERKTKRSNHPTILREHSQKHVVQQKTLLQPSAHNNRWCSNMLVLLPLLLLLPPCTREGWESRVSTEGATSTKQSISLSISPPHPTSRPKKRL